MMKFRIEKSKMKLVVCLAEAIICAVMCKSSFASDIKISVEREIYIPLGLPSPWPIKAENQYAKLEWSSVTNELAASIYQAPFIYIVNPTNGHYRKIINAERGGEFSIAWSSKSHLLIADVYKSFNLYDVAPESPLSKTIDKVGETLTFQGLQLTDGRDVFVRTLQTTLPYVGHVFIQDAQDGHILSRWYQDPNYPIQRIWDAVTTKIDGKLYSAIWLSYQTPRADSVYHNPINAPTNSATDIWIINLTNGGVKCKLDIFDGRQVDRWGNDPPTNSGVGSMAISPNGLQLVSNSTKSFDVFDMNNCKQIKRIEDYSIRGLKPGKLRFSGDGKYVIGITPDVHSSKGGWLRIWKTSDWTKVLEESIPEPQSLATDNSGKYFAVGFATGKIIIYKFNN